MGHGLEHCCWSCSNQLSGIHWNHETDLFVVISQDQVEPGYATTWIKWKYVGETVFQNLQRISVAFHMNEVGNNRQTGIIMYALEMGDWVDRSTVVWRHYYALLAVLATADPDPSSLVFMSNYSGPAYAGGLQPGLASAFQCHSLLLLPGGDAVNSNSGYIA